MILNINNIPQASNTPSGEPAGAKKTVELHHIFSAEVLNNTRQAFEKMYNLKIIAPNDFERVNKIIDKIVTDKNSCAPAPPAALENRA
ncbi:MAG: hypothetical protein BWY32_00166 [bacterium ADurb.Bin243]|nr:MAG: hypothetical protein BWY32_00166 [bacterium ADurb.Bin243]